MDCLQTVSELYIYISSVTLPVNDPYQTLVSLFYEGMIALHFLWGCLICLIVFVVKLLTGFEAFGPPVKDLAVGVSVVIFDGASVVFLTLKAVGTSTVQ